jgi:hypothetical protein
MPKMSVRYKLFDSYDSYLYLYLYRKLVNAPRQQQQHIRKWLGETAWLVFIIPAKGILLLLLLIVESTCLVEVCPWLVAALYQCIFIALYVRKKCNSKTALFVAFNLVNAKNCIIRRSYVGFKPLLRLLLKVQTSHSQGDAKYFDIFHVGVCPTIPFRDTV